jgi:ubiquinone/menaquinone biosynthesis C-methylase UbiE
MNYGYADGTRAPALEPRDEAYRYELQLYRHVTDGIDLAGKNVLEVGCGRGGGASYVARYFRPDHILAVDLAAQAVASCQALHRLPNLTFQQASAASLPCASASIDVVINVESSHCYADIEAFIAEVRRVLRPGGYLAFCDMRWPRVAAELRHQFNRAGFVERRHRIITGNVLASLDRLAERRQEICHAVPRWLRPAMRDFTGVHDTAVYDMLRAGRLVYVSLLLQKPQLAAHAERLRSNLSFGEELAIR